MTPLPPQGADAYNLEVLSEILVREAGFHGDQAFVGCEAAYLFFAVCCVLDRFLGSERCMSRRTLAQHFSHSKLCSEPSRPLILVGV